MKRRPFAKGLIFINFSNTGEIPFKRQVGIVCFFQEGR